MYIDDATEREMRLRDVPLTDELKRDNPELYDEILKLRRMSEDYDMELLEKWEEIEEEPKKFWCVLDNGNIAMSDDTDEDLEANKEIGNYFETREEAEKAVEKLKAWERLKDKGFRFEYWAYKMDEPEIENHTHFKIVGVCEDGVRFDDLDLLFGGEE